MNRRSGAKKQTPARRPKKTAGKRPPASKRSSSGNPVDLTLEASDYVTKLAGAMSAVSAAQDKWIQEVETASRNPALLQDPACQAKLGAAIRSVVSAAGGLQIEPVPEGMQAAAELLRRAQVQAELAGAGQRDGGGSLSTAAIVASIGHLDEMGQLLQQAYALIRR